MSDVVEFKLFREGAILPVKSTEGAAGYDVFAWNLDQFDGISLVSSGQVVAVRTGLNVNIPKGYEIQVRPRSGMALKHSVTVLNTPGTVDYDYCPGENDDSESFELKVILINHNKFPFTVKHGERIAQLVINKLPEVSVVEVEQFTRTNNTDRKGGFGSTGV